MNSLAGQVNVTGLGIFASLAQLGIEGRISRITLPPVYTPSCVAPPATFLGLIGERTRMFRSPVAAAAPQSDQDVLITPDELVPLSVLGLDLGVPPEGWPSFLGSRGISFRSDDLGRNAISRGEARRLLDERREAELKKQRKQAVLEQEQVEADQLRRAQIWRGVPADSLPPDVLPATAMLQAAKDAQPHRRSMLEESLGGGTLTYHPLPSGQDEA